jgi:predicted cobalt transporter CbtA
MKSTLAFLSTALLWLAVPDLVLSERTSQEKARQAVASASHAKAPACPLADRPHGDAFAAHAPGAERTHGALRCEGTPAPLGR